MSWLSQIGTDSCNLNKRKQMRVEKTEQNWADRVGAVSQSLAEIALSTAEELEGKSNFSKEDVRDLKELLEILARNLLSLTELFETHMLR